MNHTLGPWEPFHNGLRPSIVIYGEAGSEIATVRDADEAEANALLIAAAPELLEALKEVISITDRQHHAWDRAHAAIEKAEGR